MNAPHSPEIEFEHDDFDFTTTEDELRVDERCQTLLQQFYLHLLNQGVTATRASELAFAADFYLRDYLLDFSRQNVVRPVPGIVRRFAATWFIIHTLDPDMEVLQRHLDGIGELYRFLHLRHLVSASELAGVEDELAQTDFYRQRIEDFLKITGDGYFAWEAECSLRCDT